MKKKYHTVKDWDLAFRVIHDFCDERSCKECERKEDCEKKLKDPPAKARE